MPHAPTRPPTFDDRQPGEPEERAAILEIRRVAETLEALERSAVLAEQRLVAVLAPARPEAQSDAPTPVPSASPLTQELREIRRRLERLHALLDALLERVEV